jgi:hypothetical protein
VAPLWICTDRRLPPDSSSSARALEALQPLWACGLWFGLRAWRPPKGVRPAGWVMVNRPNQTSAQSASDPGTVRMGAMRRCGWPRVRSTNGTHQVVALLASSNVSDLMLIRDIQHSAEELSTLWVTKEHVGSCALRSWIVRPGFNPSRRRWRRFTRTRTDADRLWPLPIQMRLGCS